MMLRENDEFRYRAEKDFVIIEEYKRNDPVVEIPEYLDGLPVRALGDYIFAGRDCETILLPGQVNKIGRYGFYNCHKLHRLVFSDSFTDIGSGAFTGCHNIRELQVIMEREETGLKEILSEVNEELCVRLQGIVDGVLWFPEYYEEGVENTPARILMTQVHGSGLYYRNCFQGKKFRFTEYDSRFEMACAQESETFLLELVYGRLSHPFGLTEKAKKRYEEFLIKHRRKMAELFLTEKREESLEWLLMHYPHRREEQEEYQEIMGIALKEGSPSMISMLMEYGRTYFPPKRRSFDL
ncbi:MAG: leucine-rich repeat domain-containing protein [Eubacteriales bacterium]|nr:leucine-rich repeat domain-containing protein [Eubacteriales bacterium]